MTSEKRADSITTSVENEIKKQLNNKSETPEISDYTGTYKDAWFGNVTVQQEKKNNIIFTSKKSSDLTGKMTFYKGTTYVVRWNDRSLKADAFVNFTLDTEGKANGFTISPISPLTDFSYDFQDLDFKRVK
jgi:hypothetical protein